jgi:hypothetical protein
MGLPVTAGIPAGDTDTRSDLRFGSFTSTTSESKIGDPPAMIAARLQSQ